MPPPGLDFHCLTDTGRNLLAFSGGPDSLCLLHLLARSRYADSVDVVHVDHGLDPESGERAATARELASALGFECAIERVSVGRDGGPEAAARHARYRALAGRMRPGDHLLTAHHADDQAETVLLRLMRGAGPAGLAAMPARRRFGAGWLTRPLLRWTRTGILKWLDRNELHPIEDPGNRNLALDRNFLRLEVLPLLRQRWPEARDVLSHVAELQRDAAGAVELRAESDLRMLDRRAPPAHGLPAAPRLDQTGWLELPEARALALLRHWCLKLGNNPPRHHRMAEFRRQCRDAGPDRQPVLETPELRLAGWHGWLWLEPQRWPIHDWSRDWRDGDVVELPAGGRLTWRGAARADFGRDWRLGPPRPGDRMRLHPNGPRRKLADLMREREIPPWRRSAAACLRIDGTVRALGHELLEADFERWRHRTGSALEWQPEDGSLLP